MKGRRKQSSGGLSVLMVGAGLREIFTPCSFFWCGVEMENFRFFTGRVSATQNI